MKKTGDLTLVKKINKSIVLDHIRHPSPVSRARIAELTGLTKATVSSLVNELLESGLAHEIGTGESSGGRKPVMLVFNGSAGHAIGVDLGVNYMYAVLTDLTGSIIAESRLEHRNDSVETVIALLKDTIRGLKAEAPESVYGIVGIGIGIPGICDEDGVILFAPNLGWKQVPLQQLIEEEFDIPVVIDNEANAGAVGEKEYGVGKDSPNLTYVSIGMGIGSGLIVKGELYRGSTGFAGEIGHMTIDRDGLHCRCGNLGCWELYASEHWLLEAAEAEWPGQSHSVESLIALAESGHAAAVRLFERLGTSLGIGLVSIVNGFNPGLIVIGGRLASAKAWLERPLSEVLEQRSLPYARALLDVQFSSLGIRSTVLGACSFAIGRFFSSTKVTVG